MISLDSKIPFFSSLDRSKRNIEQKFIAIGLTSEFEASLKLFEAVLPKWFKGMYKFYDTVIKNKRDSMKTGGMVKPSAETRAFLEEKMKYEIELYEWIILRFREQVKLYNITIKDRE